MKLPPRFSKGYCFAVFALVCSISHSLSSSPFIYSPFLKKWNKVLLKKLNVVDTPGDFLIPVPKGNRSHFLFCFICSVLSDSLWPHVDCSPLGSSVHETLQARILGWVAVSFSRGSSWSRDPVRVSCVSGISRQILYHWATREAQPLLLTI